MKKIMLALIAVLSFTNASAQFKVEEKQSAPELVFRSPLGGHQRLYAIQQTNGEYYFFIAISTTNQYDDLMLIHLGKQAKTKATLAQLINDLHSQGATYQLSDDRGEPFTLECVPLGEYRLSKKGYAGNAYLSISNVRKMLERFE